ncbi:hypothetical protein FHR92_000800 [Fontibacillus solani]|uniref:Uncharacterized protein n=1 Tax=Fontibacillus solani TaxID=1572857 RepID=A0A7W3SQG5_9BACL|nr:hypothetical protein [Fontibacillus solani]MBA9084346.1 hypothetical protein [Fontibacillus solani]
MEILVLLVGIRWLFIRAAQKIVVDSGGNWTVSGLNLSQGDIISVTAQYAVETVSTPTTTIVAAAPIQTTHVEAVCSLICKGLE